MKVLLGIDTWYPKFDGVVIATENYCKYLNEGGESKVVVPDYKDKAEAAAHGEHAIFTKTLRLPIFKGYACPMPKLDRALEKEISDGGYDVLHAHSPFTIGEYFVKMGKKYHIPTAYTFHTKYKDEFEARFKTKIIPNYLMKRIIRTISSFDYVFAVSEGSAETLKSYGYKGDIKVIRNGTDLTSPRGREESELVADVNEQFDLFGVPNVFLYVGRLVEVKNIPFSLEVMKKLKDGGLKFKFLIAGEGEEKELLEEKISELDLGDEVKLIGNIENRDVLQGLYLRSDLFLLPSVFDNASLTIIEAASEKLPSIVPVGSSISEVIKDGKNGFTEELSVDKWAERIKEILIDKQKLALIGGNASRTVYRSWKDVVEEVKVEYSRIIEEYSRGNK
ncbi:MAG: glycosyltransferase [Clostridia bacterium]|nr:glycosyltransferase [Clostridia bacterium]